MSLTIPKTLEPLADAVFVYSKHIYNRPNIFNDVAKTYQFILNILLKRSPRNKLKLQISGHYTTGFSSDKYFFVPKEYIHKNNIESHPLNLEVLYEAIDYGLSKESVLEFITDKIVDVNLHFQEAEQNTFISLIFESNSDDPNNTILKIPLYQGLRFSKLICNLYSEFDRDTSLTVFIPIACSKGVCEKLQQRFSCDKSDLVLDLNDTIMFTKIVEFLDISVYDRRLNSMF